MKAVCFAKRNIKELLRDPVSLIFCICLPLFLLVIFQQFNIPNEMFLLKNFTPGIIVFSFGFLTLFTAQLIARDRETSLLSRLFSSPMKSSDYIVGYSLALLPLAIIQSVLFFIAAVLMGLDFNMNVIYTILVSLPISLLFIGLGILVGSFASEKQAPGIGSLVVQLIAFTSGMWFPIETVGKVYGYVCKILPFSYSVNVTRDILIGNNENLITSLIVLVLYTLIIFVLSSVIFKKKMTSD